ncbi:MAG: InlB B-repeat-containing protein [Lachnospiraceae bacterium]|nr:InlB B-repeat-containing protein [Lachnospiraceae bacterium]
MKQNRILKKITSIFLVALMVLLTAVPTQADTFGFSAGEESVTEKPGQPEDEMTESAAVPKETPADSGESLPAESGETSSGKSSASGEEAAAEPEAAETCLSFSFEKPWYVLLSPRAEAFDLSGAREAYSFTSRSRNIKVKVHVNALPEELANPAVYAVEDGVLGALIASVREGDEFTYSLNEVQGLALAEGESLTKEQTIPVIVGNGAAVSLSGQLPAGADVSVVPAETGISGALCAYDITINDGWQPEEGNPVEVTIRDESLAAAGGLAVFHLREDGTSEEVEVTDSGEGRVSFAAKGFSVYYVTSSTYTRTYHLYNTDNTERTTYNEITVSPQMVTSGGGSLILPVLADSAEGSFLGWYPGTYDTSTGTVSYSSDTAVVGGEVDGSGITSSGTVNLFPKYGTIRKVIFHGDLTEGVYPVVKTLIKSEDNYSVNLASEGTVVADRGTSEIFVGWTTTPGSDTREYTTIQTISGLSGDLNLYPVFDEVYWIRYESNLRGATYNAAVAVPTGTVITNLSNIPYESGSSYTPPTLSGYEFEGWYTTNTISGSTFAPNVSDKAFNADGSSVNGSYTVNSDVTFYGNWTDAVTYTVNVWKQRVTDAVDAADNAKTYDFAGTLTYSFNGTLTVVNEVESGTVTLSDGFFAGNENTWYDGTSDRLTFDGGTSYEDLTGFHFNADNSSASGTVVRNGSGTLDAKFDRNVVSYELYKISSSTTGIMFLTKYTDTTMNNKLITITALYGRKLTSELYGENYDSYEWFSRYTSCGSNNTSDNSTDDANLVNITTAYKQVGNNLSYNLYGLSLTDTKKVQIYIQTDGEADSYNNYEYAGTIGNGNATSYTVDQDLIEGYEPYKYNRYNTSNGWTGYADIENSIAMGSGYNKIAVMYKKIVYTLTAQSSLDSTVLGSSTYACGTSVTAPTYSTPSGYEFSGWYTDAACTNRLFFGEPNSSEASGLRSYSVLETMPDHDLTVYAGFSPIEYVVIADPNYGTLGSGSTYFWSKYKVKIEEYTDISRNYVESDEGTHYYYKAEYNYYTVSEGSHRRAGYVEIGGTPAPEAAFIEYVNNNNVSNTANEVVCTIYTDKKYIEDPTVYEFVGWFDKNGQPFNFDVGIGEDPSVVDPVGTVIGATNTAITYPSITLTARWQRKENYTIRYEIPEGHSGDTISGTSAQTVTDSSVYKDGGVFTADYSISGTDSVRFAGWQVNGEGTIYLPHSQVTINASEMADENKIIKMIACYQDGSTTASITYNANGGSFSGLASDYVSLTNNGYSWTALEDGGSVIGYTVGGISQNESFSTYLDGGNFFTRAGYEFEGWDANQNSSNPKFPVDTVRAGNRVIQVAGDNTLYAIWRENDKAVYIIGDGAVWNDNSGAYAVWTGDDEIPASGYYTEVLQGAIAPIPDNPSKDGYAFIGWSETEGGEALSAMPAVDGNKAFYAIWHEGAQVYYDVNGGVWTDSSNQYGKDENGLYLSYEGASAPSDPTRVGFVFRGWYETTRNGNKHYVARWGVAMDACLALFDENGSLVSSTDVGPIYILEAIPEDPSIITLEGIARDVTKNIGLSDAAAGLIDGYSYDFAAYTANNVIDESGDIEESQAVSRLYLNANKYVAADLTDARKKAFSSGEKLVYVYHKETTVDLKYKAVVYGQSALSEPVWKNSAGPTAASTESMAEGLSSIFGALGADIGSASDSNSSDMTGVNAWAGKSSTKRYEVNAYALGPADADDTADMYIISYDKLYLHKNYEGFSYSVNGTTWSTLYDSSGEAVRALAAYALYFDRAASHVGAIKVSRPIKVTIVNDVAGVEGIDDERVFNYEIKVLRREGTASGDSTRFKKTEGDSTVLRNYNLSLKKGESVTFDMFCTKEDTYTWSNREQYYPYMSRSTTGQVSGYEDEMGYYSWEELIVTCNDEEFNVVIAPQFIDSNDEDKTAFLQSDKHWLLTKDKNGDSDSANGSIEKAMGSSRILGYTEWGGTATLTYTHTRQAQPIPVHILRRSVTGNYEEMSDWVASTDATEVTVGSDAVAIPGSTSYASNLPTEGGYTLVEATYGPTMFDLTARNTDSLTLQMSSTDYKAHVGSSESAETLDEDDEIYLVYASDTRTVYLKYILLSAGNYVTLDLRNYETTASFEMDYSDARTVASLEGRIAADLAAIVSATNYYAVGQYILDADGESVDCGVGDLKLVNSALGVIVSAKDDDSRTYATANELTIGIVLARDQKLTVKSKLYSMGIAGNSSDELTLNPNINSTSPRVGSSYLTDDAARTTETDIVPTFRSEKGYDENWIYSNAYSGTDTAEKTAPYIRYKTDTDGYRKWFYGQSADAVNTVIDSEGGNQVLYLSFYKNQVPVFICRQTGSSYALNSDWRNETAGPLVTPTAVNVPSGTTYLTETARTAVTSQGLTASGVYLAEGLADGVLSNTVNINGSRIYGDKAGLYYLDAENSKTYLTPGDGTGLYYAYYMTKPSIEVRYVSHNEEDGALTVIGNGSKEVGGGSWTSVPALLGGSIPAQSGMAFKGLALSRAEISNLSAAVLGNTAPLAEDAVYLKSELGSINYASSAEASAAEQEGLTVLYVIYERDVPAPTGFASGLGQWLILSLGACLLLFLLHGSRLRR